MLFEANIDMNNPQVKKGTESKCMDKTMESCCPPIYECPEERVCHREFVHEVKHVVPINTRVINHHVYRHTFMPCYTCCEENEICNVYERRCKF